jgi:NAD(P)-dependent dehydrogenase (short-subunit alcohol dehydrogenase family)
MSQIAKRSRGSSKALDVLVHNAAYFPVRSFAAIDAELLDRTLVVNLKAAFWLTQSALPLRAAIARQFMTNAAFAAHRSSHERCDRDDS